MAVGILLLATQPSYAKEQNTDIVVTLCVEQSSMEENGIASGTYSYVLSAMEEGNPLPEGGEEGILNFELTGESRKELTLTYREAGVYTYRLQQKSSEQNYTIENYVIQDRDGNLIVNTTIRHQDGNKAPGLFFTIPTVKKDTLVSQTPVKTGDVQPIFTFMLLFGIAGVVLFERKKQS